jgi:hypothetical protein
MRKRVHGKDNGMKMRSGNTGSSFTLQFLTDTGEYPANATKQVAAAYVELGRDKECAVRFGEDAPTVSRKHAALERKGQKVYIYNLSETNQTLVNGRPVHKEWLLHDGDEIQLSADGPRMRFVLPADHHAPRFTSRIKMFAEQAVRPYRLVLLALLGIFLVGAAAVGIQFTKVRSGQARLVAVAQSVTQQVQDQQKALAVGNSVLVAEQTRRAEALAAVNKQNQEFQEALTRQSKIIKALVKNATARPPRRPRRAEPVRKPDPEAVVIGNTQGQVYAVRIYLTVRGNTGQPLDLTDGNRKSVRLKDYFLGTGTGFVLEDGRFVTSRRWVKPWAYPEGEKDLLGLFTNFVHHNGGRASVKLIATAPGGPELTLSDAQFAADSTGDQTVTGNFGFGEGKIVVAGPDHTHDWAVAKVPITGLPVSNAGALSTTGNPVHLLGYEIPAGAQEGPVGSPTYTRRTVTPDAPARGTLAVRGAPFEMSTYGGPAYHVRANQALVVGLLTGGKDGKGYIIPLNRLAR